MHQPLFVNLALTLLLLSLSPWRTMWHIEKYWKTIKKYWRQWKCCIFCRLSRYQTRTHSHWCWNGDVEWMLHIFLFLFLAYFLMNSYQWMLPIFLYPAYFYAQGEKITYLHVQRMAWPLSRGQSMAMAADHQSILYKYFTITIQILHNNYTKTQLQLYANSLQIPGQSMAIAVDNTLQIPYKCHTDTAKNNYKNTSQMLYKCFKNTRASWYHSNIIHMSYTNTSQ